MRPEPDKTAVPALRIRGLTKRFGSQSVFEGLELDIPEKQRLSIIGGSGSGKTTLLRTIVGLEPIQDGVIEVFGRPLLWHRTPSGLVPDKSSAARAVRTNIGMVFQQFNLFPHMTALGNIIEAPVRVRGLSQKTAREKAAELLEKVGLADKMNSLPRELSGGQQQRVAIARTLAMQPRIILFDEVTSALDPERVGEVLQVLRDLASEGDITMIIVTHEMRFAREIADRTIFMEFGKIIEDGRSEVIFGSPSHERTKRFLSSVLSV